jgi:type I restriction enzyme S subunit
VTTLRRVATTRGGAGFPHLEQGLDDGELPFIKVSDFNHKGNERTITQCANWVSRMTARRLGASVVPGDSLLLPKVGAAMLGNARRLTSQPSVFDNNVLAVVPGRIESRYLHYWLSTVDTAAFAKPGPVPSMGDDALLDLVVPVDELAAQRAIADYLDAETTRIDALIAKKRQLIRRLEERLASETEGLVATRASAYAALKRSARFFTDGDWIEAPFITDAGIRLIQTGNIGRGEFKNQGDRYISDETFVDLKCTEVRAGDVLISRLANTVGQACVAPDLGVRMVTSVDVVILRPRPDFDASFLVEWLSTPRHLERARLEARGTTMQRLARSQVGELPVPVLPLDEQRAIAQRSASARARHRATIDHIVRQIDLLAEHRQALVTSVVAGETVDRAVEV